MASDKEIEAAARVIYEARFNIDFDHASAVEIELALSSARAALEAAERVRAEQPQVPTMFPIRGTAD